MKVIVLGSANQEVFLSSGSLVAVTGEENFLERFVGGKFDLKSYRIRPKPRATRYSFSFRRTVRGRKKLDLVSKEKMALSPGGSGFSIAIFLKKFGAKVALATAMIEIPLDFFFVQIREEAKAHGIRMLPSFGNQINPLSFIICGFKKGEERSVVFPYKPPYILKPKKTLDAIRVEEGVTHVIATGIRRMEELPFIAKVFRTARARNPNVVTFFMPNASLLPRTPRDLRRELREVLEETSIWQMNAREAGIFLGNTNLSFAERVRTLARRGGVATTIITRGARGAAAVVNGKYYDIPPFNVSVVDNDAGAGDAFAAGLFGAMNLGCEDPDEQFRLAAFVAGKKIEERRGYEGTPSLEAMRQYFQQLRERKTQIRGQP